MTVFASEDDMRHFMNCLTAHNLILRALLIANPDVADQLRAFTLSMDSPNDDQRAVKAELLSVLPRAKP